MASREASFWKIYAQKNDELRHELVERPWYGREVTGEAAWEPEVEDLPDYEGTIWAQEHAEGNQTAQMEDLYGAPAQNDQAPSIETPAPEPQQMEPE